MPHAGCYLSIHHSLYVRLTPDGAFSFSFVRMSLSLGPEQLPLNTNARRFVSDFLQLALFQFHKPPMTIFDIHFIRNFVPFSLVTQFS